MKKLLLRNAILAFAVVGLLQMVACKNESAKADDSATNAVIENMMNRKSVREYKDRPVEEEKIDIMLRAAMAAPSGMDRRPWQFVVIQDKEVLKAMAIDLPYAKMLNNVNQAIVVCGDSAISNYWYLDCSTAVQNILLAAESLDLGAVWTAAYPYEDRMAVVRKNLGIPDNIQPLCVIPFGYPMKDEQPKDKYDPKRIHRNKY